MAQQTGSHPQPHAGSSLQATGRPVVYSTQGVISSGQYLKSMAGMRMLLDGGNAFDAFITAVFLQNVVDYHQVSLFGAMGGLIYEAATGEYYAWESYSERPLAGRCGEGDPSQVAIGGKVLGLKALADRGGTRPWASYLEPAIAAAEEGVIVTSIIATTIRNCYI